MEMYNHCSCLSLLVFDKNYLHASLLELWWWGRGLGVDFCLLLWICTSTPLNRMLKSYGGRGLRWESDEVEDFLSVWQIEKREDQNTINQMHILLVV